ncbi:hypothetical protein KM043_016044 [Ampulex compressa]|nr:hypothetical protein KM043_016044 [Ampulex compressa]
MFNITRAIIYAWRAGQRPHNLDQWAELACSTTLRLVPYGVYLSTLYLNASRDAFCSRCSHRPPPGPLCFVLIGLFAETSKLRSVSPNGAFRASAPMASDDEVEDRESGD